jgi:hypothetical protein
VVAVVSTLSSKLGVWREQRETRREARDRKRGYRFSYEALIIAVFIEAVVIGASFYGNYMFARQYNHGSADLLWMAMMAPIIYVAMECVRIPAALGIRLQPARWLCVICWCGIFCSVGITAKTVSQLGDIMFRPRLIDVLRAEKDLQLAKAEQASLAGKIVAADKAVADAVSMLDKARQADQANSDQIKAAPKDFCAPTSWTDKAGQLHKGCVQKSDRTRTAMLDKTKVLMARINKAEADYDAAVQARAALDPKLVDQQVAKAEAAYREAVMRSQLHSLTATVYGKSPNQVTDTEMYQFLRIFVLVAAVFAGFAATIPAFLVITKLPPETVTLDPAGLNDFLDMVYARAKDDLTADATVTADNVSPISMKEFKCYA